MTKHVAEAAAAEDFGLRQQSDDSACSKAVAGGSHEMPPMRPDAQEQARQTRFHFSKARRTCHALHKMRLRARYVLAIGHFCFDNDASANVPTLRMLWLFGVH